MAQERRRDKSRDSGERFGRPGSQREPENKPAGWENAEVYEAQMAETGVPPQPPVDEAVLEANELELDPLFASIIALRKIDDAAKIEQQPLPAMERYRQLIVDHLCGKFE